MAGVEVVQRNPMLENSESRAGRISDGLVVR